MWEEMLSVLIERFSGDTLLASQEDLTKISRLVDTWKDTAIKVPASGAWGTSYSKPAP